MEKCAFSEKRHENTVGRAAIGSLERRLGRKPLWSIASEL